METRRSVNNKGKSVSRYIWEFIILLIAVTAGVFLNNAWQEKTTVKKEKEKVKSLAEGLKSDLTSIDANVRLRNSRFVQIDSLVKLITEKKIFGFENDLYYYGRLSTRSISYTSDDKTSMILKEPFLSGRFKSQVIKDTILLLEQSLKSIKESQQKETDWVKMFYPFLIKIFSPVEFDKLTQADGSIIKPQSEPYLRSSDAEQLNDFVFYLNEYKIKIRETTALLKRFRIRAEGIVEYLQHEYRF